MEAKCGHVVVGEERTVALSRYLMESDGSRGLELRPFRGNRKLFGKLVLVQLTES